ncbi:hypothetical protein [Shinella sp.]|uniref:hypothetical protein n=1 Tax=Shinella sp. TaxID=1870904 RepID=UPI0029B5C872|nr:hypothetical protein [Shinella sp.]MDX3977020.1 hypothetical protein [Shinella sp.]
MPNDTVPVAGEAVPATLSRRFFLSRMGGVAAASALAAAPATAASGIMENSALLALGKRFEVAHADLMSATEKVREVQPLFRVIAPAIPRQISGDQFERFFGWRYAELLRDPACPKMSDLKGPKGQRIVIIKSYNVEREFKDRKMPQPDRRLHRLSKGFEEATTAALESSGMAAALEAYHAADGSLRHIVHSMSEVRARTPAGLAIKVRATGAYAALGTDERFSASLWLANSIWGDLEEGEVL